MKPLRILVVEDDRDSAKMLELLLSRQADEVAVADSVRTALTRAAEPWDVVISDLSLPDGSGNAVATAFRKGTPRPRRIIALSGSGSAVDVAASARAGFDSHLVKPLQVSALLEMLDRLRMH